MPSWQRSLKLGATTLLLAVGTLTGALWLAQDALIYPAPHYSEHELKQLPAGLTALRDLQAPSSLLAFYRPPETGKLSRLWLAFGGNGDVALRWDPLLAPAAEHGTGILMVEYPGYGARAGKPSPESLAAGTETALQALAQALGEDVAELRPLVSVLGYSLGSAAALGYAARQPVRCIVLVAPFTSMLDMARLTVGRPLSLLLRHHYDNRASLHAIRARAPTTPVYILHGDADTLIPSGMGSELASLMPGSRFELVPGAGHADVVELARERLQVLLKN